MLAYSKPGGVCVCVCVFEGEREGGGEILHTEGEGGLEFFFLILP